MWVTPWVDEVFRACIPRATFNLGQLFCPFITKHRAAAFLCQYPQVMNNKGLKRAIVDSQPASQENKNGTLALGGPLCAGCSVVTPMLLAEINSDLGM